MFVCKIATPGRTFVKTALFALFGAFLATAIRTGDFAAAAAEGFAFRVVDFDVDAAQRRALDAVAMTASLTVGAAGVLFTFRKSLSTGEADLFTGIGCLNEFWCVAADGVS